MKKNTLYLMILILLAAAAVYLARKPAGNTSEIEKGMFRADSSSVTGFSVEGPGGISVLKRSGTGWSLEKDRDFPADVSLVNTMLAYVHDHSVGNIISEKSDKHAKFGVDSAGTILRLTHKDGGESTLIIGNDDRDRRHSFYRLPGTDPVYIGSLYPRYRLKSDPDSWRDKSVVILDEKSVQNIRFLKGSSSAEISRRDGSWHATLNGKDAAIDGTKAGNAVKKLTGLKASGFADEKDISGITDPLTVIINTDSGSEELLFTGTEDAYEVYSRNKKQVYVLSRQDFKLIADLFGM